MREEEVVKVVTSLSALSQGYEFAYQAVYKELQQWAVLANTDQDPKLPTDYRWDKVFVHHTHHRWQNLL